MSALEQALADYLQLRHSLGHDLSEAGWLLPGFVAYLDAHGLGTVTVEALVTRVARSAGGRAQQATMNGRTEVGQPARCSMTLRRSPTWSPLSPVVLAQADAGLTPDAKIQHGQAAAVSFTRLGRA